MVGYRYSQEELSVLMSLQGAGVIPCLPLVPFPSQEQFVRGLESLEQGSVLSQTGGRVLLDKVHALLITSLCACDTYAALSDGESAAALCRCEKLCLLMHVKKGRCVLRAAPALSDFEALLSETAALFPGDAEIRLCLSGKEEFRETLAGEALLDRFRQAYEKLPR